MINGYPGIAVIGAGNWGKNHVRVFNRLRVLVCVVEADANLRSKIKEQYPGVKVRSNYSDVLNSSEIDAVVIATPAATHYSLARKALEAGKDVLVEKPMTLSVKEAEDLNTVAENRQKLLMVGHLLLYKQAVQEIIRYVKNGYIGNIVNIEMRRRKLGKVRNQENVLWSFAPHDIAVLLELANSTVKELIPMGMTALQPDIEDDYRVHLTFKNNIQAHIHVSWLWPEDERKTTIIGTEGMITYDEHENKVWLYRKGIHKDLNIWDEGKEELEIVNNDALEEEARHFLKCVANRELPVTDGKKGRDVIDILVQAHKIAKNVMPKTDYFAHESACIDDGALIGGGTRIWHFCHVMPGAEIGTKCSLGQNVFVANNVKIGDNVKIQNNVSVYEGVILEDDVFCGPSMVFTNVKTPRSAFPRNTSGDYYVTIVKRGASIGANATIICGITIGEHAFVAAGAVVTKDVPAHSMVAGVPATVIGWVCVCGVPLKYEDGLGSIDCAQCGRRYEKCLFEMCIG
ncbi:MAG: hypothetical protein VR67_19010 [Peptococcaceae bacterium BRH_c8a]|nr:MAG: hypothetical protein VR67_19010 [Peptococcaceae bacterium BRH_c8a]